MATKSKKSKQVTEEVQEKGLGTVDHVIDYVDIACSIPGSTFLWGPPGTGKSFAAKLALIKHGINRGQIYQLSLADDYTIQELLGHYVPRDGAWVWEPGPIVKAMGFTQYDDQGNVTANWPGGALVVNELGRASAAVQDAFLGIMDSDDVRQIDVIGAGRIEAHDEFRLVATSNSPPEDLDDALRDRFDASIEIKTPAPGVIAELNNGFEGLGNYINNSFEDEKRCVSPRRGLSFMKHYRNLGGPIKGDNEKESNVVEIAAKLAFGAKADDFIMTMNISRVREEQGGKRPILRINDDQMIVKST